MIGGGGSAQGVNIIALQPPKPHPPHTHPSLRPVCRPHTHTQPCLSGSPSCTPHIAAPSIGTSWPQRQPPSTCRSPHNTGPQAAAPSAPPRGHRPLCTASLPASAPQRLTRGKVQEASNKGSNGQALALYTALPLGCQATANPRRRLGTDTPPDCPEPHEPPSLAAAARLRRTQRSPPRLPSPQPRAARSLPRLPSARAGLVPPPLLQRPRRRALPCAHAQDASRASFFSPCTCCCCA